MNEVIVENKLKDSFFGTTNIGKAIKRKESPKTEINTKGINRKHTEQWDIKLSIGSKTFQNIVNFLSETGYDVVLKFRKNEMIMYIIDLSSTHVSFISIAKTEFAEYEVVGLTNDNEKVCFVDISIVEDLMVNEDYPIDVYIDTLDTMMYHIVNGKEVVSRRILSMDDNLSLVLQSYKSSDEKVQLLIGSSEYQKVVVVHNALKTVLNSIAKKGGKDKDVMLVNMNIGPREIDFRIQGELKRASVLLSGEDILVYPMKSEVLEMKIEYFKKFSKLELSYPVNLYCNREMPLIFETKLGGGGIRLYFIVAPRVSEPE